MLTQVLPVLLYALLASGQREIHSTFFNTCMNNSQITALEFSVSIFDNRTITIFLNGTSTFVGNDTLGYELLDNGIQKYKQTFDPCTVDDFPDFCPISTGPVSVVNATREIPSDVPIIDDLFAGSTTYPEFRLNVNNTLTNLPVGCLKATLPNPMMASNASSMDNTTSPAANSSDNSGGDKGGSNGSTSYLNWTLLVSAIAVLAVGSSL